MTLPFVLSDGAEADLNETAAWHNEIAAGSGDRLVATLSAALDEIERMPNTWPRWRSHLHVRVRVVNAVRYRIFYSVLPQVVYVWAVWHQHRDDNWLDCIR